MEPEIARFISKLTRTDSNIMDQELFREAMAFLPYDQRRMLACTNHNTTEELLVGETIINLEIIIIIHHKIDPTRKSEKRIKQMTEDLRDTVITD